MEAVLRPQVGRGTGAFWPSGAAVTICTASGARQMYVKLPAHPGPGSRMSGPGHGPRSRPLRFPMLGDLGPFAHRGSPGVPNREPTVPYFVLTGGCRSPVTGPVPGRVRTSRQPLLPLVGGLEPAVPPPGIVRRAVQARPGPRQPTTTLLRRPAPAGADRLVGGPGTERGMSMLRSTRIIPTWWSCSTRPASPGRESTRPEWSGRTATCWTG